MVKVGEVKVMAGHGDWSAIEVKVMAGPGDRPAQVQTGGSLLCGSICGSVADESLGFDWKWKN